MKVLGSWKFWSAGFTLALLACTTPDAPGPALSATGSAATTSRATVTQVGSQGALDTPAQRHVLRLAPAGQPPVLLMALQRDAWSSPDPEGLHWYRSDDEGSTWRYYQPILKDATAGRELHLTVDAIAVGDDIATVVSYDSINTGFPSDSSDPNRKVYFQWWRYDGSGGWNAGARLTVATPPSGTAYHRAELARDSQGRYWVQAWLRDPCASTAKAACADTIRLWVSEDGGASFSAQPDLYRQSMLGGGRLIRLGTKLMMLWGDYSWANPALYAIRDDSDPLGSWQGPFNAFADLDSIYHGSAFSAVADGSGLDLVYKDRHEKLYYRRFNGTSFGARTLVDGNAYYTMQPAVTRRGGDLYVCVNHPVTPGQPQYEIRLYKLADGFGTWTVLANTTQTAGYPAAPERLPADAPGIPCAWSTGDWPATVSSAVRFDAPPPPTPTPTATATATPTPTPGGNAAISTLRDSFAGPIDPALWTVSRALSTDTATMSGGVLTLTPTPSSPTSRIYVKTAHHYRLDESDVRVNLRQAISATSGVALKFRIESPSNPWNEGLGFWLERGTMSAFTTTGGVSQDAGVFPWSAIDDAWLRIRETGAAFFWETSADGSTWTVRATAPDTSAVLNLDDVVLVFDVREYSTGNANPGSAKFGGLNP